MCDMRLLIDTNIFIYREDPHEIPEPLANLFKLLHRQSVQLFIHPLSLQEIKSDPNEERKRITLSKARSYLIYEDYVDPKDDPAFLDGVGVSINPHDVVDRYLLYSIYRNAFDFLLTEDKGIHRRSKNIKLNNRVFDIDEAIHFFRGFEVEERVPTPIQIEYVDVSKLDFNDPFLDSLKSAYPGSEASTGFSECGKRYQERAEKHLYTEKPRALQHY